MTAPAKQDSSTSATPTFYQLLQLDARGLWAKIRAAQRPREKRRYFLAMACLLYTSWSTAPDAWPLPRAALCRSTRRSARG